MSIFTLFITKIFMIIRNKHIPITIHLYYVLLLEFLTVRPLLLRKLRNPSGVDWIMDKEDERILSSNPFSFVVSSLQVFATTGCLNSSPTYSHTFSKSHLSQITAITCKQGTFFQWGTWHEQVWVWVFTSKTGIDIHDRSIFPHHRNNRFWNEVYGGYFKHPLIITSNMTTKMISYNIFVLSRLKGNLIFL